MKVFIVGSGGREHTLAWRIAQDSCAPEIICAPGNAGTASCGSNVDIAADDIDGLLAWARENKPDLTVVGPEAPLCAGLVDRLNEEGFRCFGPSQAAAQLEGSKSFSKDVMQAAGVPTAKSAEFTNAEDACAYVQAEGAPIVVKADGLAAGKGVTVCTSVEQAERAIHDALEDNVFGEAGSKVIVEDFLEGEEASILGLVDGEHIVLLASSQDHKRALDGDQGPNTGGMGAYSPAPIVTEDLWPRIKEEVFERTVAELRRRGITFKGVLYAGLMIDKGELQVLEFNCRFGDPEAQAVLVRWEGDFLPALEACVDGTLSEELVSWSKRPSVCIVMAAGGYPGSYGKGEEISGLDDANADADVSVFHAGTRLDADRVVTSGGRVLGVTALGADLHGAVDKAYEALSKISFKNGQYRKDIAHRALKLLKASC